MAAVVGLARPYWSSEERWGARGLLGVIVAMNLGLVYVNVLFSNWNNRFYDALQVRDFTRFSHELAYFCVLAAAFIVIAVYQTYLTQVLQIRWRRWLTDRCLGEWLGGHAYYHLQLGEYRSDNPDQRIANDLQLFVEATLALTLGLLSSVVTLASFAAILWRLSGTIDVPLGAGHLAIPGYMVWAALVYAVLAPGSRIASAGRSSGSTFSSSSSRRTSASRSCGCARIPSPAISPERSSWGD